MKYPEHQEQAAVIEWARLQERQFPEYKYLFSIPNGLLGSLTPPQRARAKAEGYRAGPTDLCWPLIIPTISGGLWLEMKSPSKRNAKNYGLTDAQLDFRVFVTAEGYEHNICYDAQEGIDALKDYHGRWRAVRKLDVPRETMRIRV